MAVIQHTYGLLDDFAPWNPNQDSSTRLHPLPPKHEFAPNLNMVSIGILLNNN